MGSDWLARHAQPAVRVRTTSSWTLGKPAPRSLCLRPVHEIPVIVPSNGDGCGPAVREIGSCGLDKHPQELADGVGAVPACQLACSSADGAADEDGHGQHQANGLFTLAGTG